MPLTPEAPFTPTPPTQAATLPEETVDTPTPASSEAQSDLDTPSAATGQPPYVPTPPGA